jgi:hypothetical protein
VSGQVEQARETPTRPAGRGHAEARLGAQGRERHEPGVRQRDATVKTLRACWEPALQAYAVSRLEDASKRQEQPRKFSDGTPCAAGATSLL